MIAMLGWPMEMLVTTNVSGLSVGTGAAVEAGAVAVAGAVWKAGCGAAGADAGTLKKRFREILPGLGGSRRWRPRRSPGQRRSRIWPGKMARPADVVSGGSEM